MRKILTLLFVLTLSASAFGAWVVESTTYLDTANVLAAYPTATSLTVAVGLINGTGNVYATSNYSQTQPWTDISITGNPPLSITAMTYGGSRLFAGGTANGFMHVRYWDGAAPWTSTSIPQLLTLYGLAASSSTTVIAVGDTNLGAKIFRSTDAGSTWPDITGAFPNLGQFILRTITYVGGNIFVAAGDAGKIYKSTDGGASWTEQTSGTANTLRDVHFYDSSVGFAVGDSAILYTLNGGSTWTSISTAVNWTAVQVVAGSTSGSYIAYLGRGSTIYSSTSSGGSFGSPTLEIDLQTVGGVPVIKDLFCDDRYNMWVAADTNGQGRIYHNITPINLTSVQLYDRAGIRSMPPGGAAYVKLTGDNIQRQNWNTVGKLTFSDSNVTASQIVREDANTIKAYFTVGATTTPGPVNITGLNADGLNAVLTGGGPVGFFISPFPTIVTVNPSRVYQNWIGTITVTGDAFQVDPLSTITFDPQTAGATVEIIGTPTIVSTTTAVTTVSATSVGNFRVWLMNADTGKGFYDFFVVNSYSPPEFNYIAFGNTSVVTYDATVFPYPPGQIISPTPRIVAVFTDNEQLFNTSSQNTAKILLVADGTLTSIYNVPASSVRLESGNTRAVIDYQILPGLALPASVNTIKAYMENSSGEARISTAARVSIRYVLMDKVPDKVALPSKHLWNPIRDPVLELQMKMKTVPPTVKVEVCKIDGTKAASLTVPTHVTLTYDAADPGNSFNLVKIQVRGSDLYELPQGMLLFVIHNEDIYAKGKVMVQY